MVAIPFEFQLVHPDLAHILKKWPSVHILTERETSLSVGLL